MQETLEPYSGRRVLVTGGTGFIGLNLVEALSRSRASLRVLSRSWPSPSPAARRLFESVEFVKADIRDEVAVESAVKDVEVVFNLAGRSGATVSNTSPLDDLDVNGRGQLTLLEACRKLAPRARVVFPSSRLVYRPGERLPVNEQAATGPLTIYGIHKLAAEHYHLLYRRSYDLPVVVLRVTNPYGPYQREEQNRYGIVNWFIHLALKGAQLPVYGDGAQLRDYVHVDDVVSALLLAGSCDAADGKVINIGSGEATSFLEMANTIVRHAGAGGVQSVPWPADASRVESGDFVADTSLAARLLRWQPRMRLDAGIADVIGRYRAAGPA